MKKYIIAVSIVILILVGIYIKGPSIPKTSININNENLEFTEYYDINYKYLGIFNRNIEKIVDNVTLKTINVSDELVLNISSSPDIDKSTLTIFEEDNKIYDEIISDEFNINEVISDDGRYLFKVTNYFGEALESTSIQTFVLDLDFPVTVDFPKVHIKQGDYLSFKLNNVNEDENITIQTDITKEVIEVYPHDNHYLGYIPISYFNEAKEYNVKILNNEKVIYDTTVFVLDEVFKIQYLYVEQSVVDSTRTDEASKQLTEVYNFARSNYIEEKLWEDKFVMPVEGRITTEFGERRYVNNSPTSYRHSGIDIAASTGTKVKAPASGVVKVSRDLILTGKTVVIDHGMGLLTYSYHLEELYLEEGAIITQGDYIGEVGSTGFSTGPHLHFSVSFKGTYVNPWVFIER